MSMLWTMLNWPGSVPDSPHDLTSFPSGENWWTRALAVPVGDVEVTVPWVDGHVRGDAEGVAAHRGGRLPRRAQGHQELPFRGELADGVVAVVRAVDGVVGADRHAVRVGEDSLPPGPQQAPVAVEHDHWAGAPVEDVDVVPGVDADRRGLPVGPAVRQVSPSLRRKPRR